MKTETMVLNKIGELFTLEEKDDKEFATPNDPRGSAFSGILNKCKKMDEVMDELRDLALEEKTLVGRTIKFPHADSHAMYIITKVNKKTVRLTWIDYMDGWQDDRLGAEGNVSLNYAEQSIASQDNLRKLFS